MATSNYAVIENGKVVNLVIWDGDGDIFSGSDTVQLAEDANVGIGYSYSAGAFIAPAATPETPEESVKSAEQQKTAIMQNINSNTQIWQTQLTLSIITDADKESLTEWMKYAQQVQAVDTSEAPDITWPEAPVNS